MYRYRSILVRSLLASILLGSNVAIATTPHPGPPGVPDFGTPATTVASPEIAPPRRVQSEPEVTKTPSPSAEEAAVIFDLRTTKLAPDDFELIQRRTGIDLADFDSKDTTEFEIKIIRKAVDPQASVERHGDWLVIRGSEASIRNAKRIRAAIADAVAPPVTLQCTILRLALADPSTAVILAELNAKTITPEDLDRIERNSPAESVLARPTLTARVGQSASIRIETNDQANIELELTPQRIQDGQIEVEVAFDSATQVTMGRRKERRGFRGEETLRIPDDGVGIVFGQPFASAVIRELDGGNRTIERTAPEDQDHMIVLVRPVPTVGIPPEDDSIYGSCKATRDGTGRTYFDREIAQVMGHLAAGWLERPQREREERTDLLIQMLALQPGMDVADIGAGSGYFTRRMAPPIKPDGVVFATDIQPEMLEYLGTSLLLEGIENVTPILGRVDNTGLAEDSVDLILLVDVYHEFDHPWEMARSMHRALRPDGRVALVEYRAGDDTVPIKPLHTMTENQARLEFEAAGFEMVESLVDGLPWQRLMIFKPRSEGAPKPARSSAD